MHYASESSRSGVRIRTLNSEASSAGVGSFEERIVHG